MRKSILVLAAYSLLAGCSSNSTLAGIPSDEFGSFNGAKVEVVAEGGIAALQLTQRVEHDSRAYVSSQRHICAQVCAAAMDTVSGTLAGSTTDSLFTIIAAQQPFSLKDDYGTTRNAADMMSYTLRVTAGGSVKIVRADDGTMPPRMRQIVDAVRGTISAARK